MARRFRGSNSATRCVAQPRAKGRTRLSGRTLARLCARANQQQLAKWHQDLAALPLAFDGQDSDRACHAESEKSAVHATKDFPAPVHISYTSRHCRSHMRALRWNSANRTLTSSGAAAATRRPRRNLRFGRSSSPSLSVDVPSNVGHTDRRVKVREVIATLEADGWQLVRTRGSHRQFRHPTKAGTVTVEFAVQAIGSAPPQEDND